MLALLMDGAQLRHRWPGVYATGLADDPGSSVLSFTSLALVDRSNATFNLREERDGSRSIGLWKNKLQAGCGFGNDFVELTIAKGGHAIVLTLANRPAHDVTLDGRPNTDTMAWFLRDKAELSLPPDVVSASGWDWIVSGALPGAE